MGTWSSVARRGAATALAGLALLLSACADDASESESGSSQATPAPQTEQTATLIEAVKKGTSVDPPAEPRPVEKGKSVVFAVNGMNQSSSKVNIDAGMEACKAVEWKCTILDGKSDPTQWPGIIRTAIAQKPDGIIVQGIDCSVISQPLKEATKAGIKTVGLDSFDCSDPEIGGEKQFDAVLLYPNPVKPEEPMDYGTYAKIFGQAKAATLIDGVKSMNLGEPNVIMVCDDEALVLKYICDGQTEEFKNAGVKVERVDTRLADLGPKLESQVSSALLKNPEANAIVSPHGGATLNIGPAVKRAGRTEKMFVMGSEGLIPELDMIRAGLVHAVLAAKVPWKGWASVDTMNQVFTGKEALNNGVGWLLVNKDNVPPEEGTDVPAEAFPDYAAGYKKAWGV